MRESVKTWIESIIETLVIILVLYFVFFPFKVSGVSMEGTLNDGDRVFASRIVATIGFVEKGDLIIFEKTINGETVSMVKRVIAIEGDAVLIKNNQLYVNGILQKEEYVLGDTAGMIEILVGKGELFVMGDNRGDSMDSRDFGVICQEEIVGRVILKAFPLTDFRVFL